MKYLGYSDWTVIVFYMAGIIAFGMWFSRGQKNTRDYFLGSRSIPWWGVGLSIVATETSALTFIGIPALAFDSDLSLIQITIGYVIARIILAIYMVPHYLRGEIYSPYQLLTQAFGRKAGRLAGACFLISGTLAAGVRVYVTCIPLRLMLGIDILTSILLFVGLSLLYTYYGGIKAVIWTDAVQFLLFVIGGVFTLFYVPMLLDGGWSGIIQKAGEAGKLHWLSTDFSWKLPFNIWMGLIGGTVQVMSSHGADQLIVQRVLSCGSVREGRKALMLSAVIILPLFLVFLLTGTMLWAYYQVHALPIALPANQAGFKQSDYIYPIFILTAVPPVLKGFLIVAILSAAMSSVSSALSALASVSTMDFLKGLLKRDDAFFFRASKYSTLFWAVMLVVVAYASREVALVLNWAFSLNGLTSGALLAGVLLAIYARRWTPAAPLGGIVISVASMVCLQIFKPEMFGWPWLTLIGTVIALATAALIQALLGRPQPAR